MSSAVPTLNEEGKKRRFWNWLQVGLGYALGYYLLRYSLPVVETKIGASLHLGAPEMGDVKGVGKGVYALFAVLIGFFADRIGGKKVMVVGLWGAGCMSILLALAGFIEWHNSTHAFTYLMLVWVVNNAFQACGALSIIAINRSWFHYAERGKLSGAFGAIIQSGRVSVGVLGILLFTVFKAPWYVMFLVPGIATVVFRYLIQHHVYNTPREAGIDYDVDVGNTEDQSFNSLSEWGRIKAVLGGILASGAGVKIMIGEFCTGFVRSGTEDWFVRYMQEVFHVNLKNPGMMFTLILCPIAAVCGGFTGGWATDRLFGSRRGPVLTLAYIGQAICLLFLGQVTSLFDASIVLVANAFFVQITHGLLTGVTSMDVGGKTGAAMAAGIFDACQYAAGMVGGMVIGRLVYHWGWGAWSLCMIIFPIVAAVVMSTLPKVHSRPTRPEAQVRPAITALPAVAKTG